MPRSSGATCDGSRVFARYQAWQEQQYRSRDDLPATPQTRYVAFTHYKQVGPLNVLVHLSPEATAAYTDALLRLDATYEQWVMWHTGSNRETYPKMKCESLPIWLLRAYGRVQTPAGIVPLDDALGPQPASPAALHALLQHPNADKIKEALDLSDPVPELFGEGDPTPLTDIWPGLGEYLPAHRRNARLVPCERIRVAGAERRCVSHGQDVYLVGSVDDDERTALELVAEALDLGLGHGAIEAILQRRTPAEIEERRAAVRRYLTDAERLLAAVGEQTLRTGLPPSLLDVLEDGHESLTATEIAEAAIATYHTDALRSFKWALDHLDPPARWSSIAARRGVRPFSRVLRRMGGRAQEDAPGIHGDRRAPVASRVAPLPTNCRRQRARVTPLQRHQQWPATRHGHHADRVGEDPGCGPGDRRSHTRRRVPRRRALGRGS